MKKACTKCGKEKEVTEFSPTPKGTYGVHSQCKQCKREYAANRWKNDPKYRERKKISDSTPERKEYFLKKGAEYRANPEIREKKRQYMENYWGNPENKKRELDKRKTPEGRAASREIAKRWRKNNPEKAKEFSRRCNKKRRQRQDVKDWRNAYEKKKRDTDPYYKALICCRSRMNKVIHNRSMTTRSILGCNEKTFLNHIEKQFEDWMSWDNYGSHWHYDHIIPCNYFDLTTKNEQKICFNYRNLQPLSISENCSKQDTLPKNSDELYAEIKTALNL